MAGLIPAIHAKAAKRCRLPWMPTIVRGLKAHGVKPGHDDVFYGRG